MEDGQAVGRKFGVGRQNLRAVDRRVHGVHNRGRAQKGQPQTIDSLHLNVGIGLIRDVVQLIELISDHQVIVDVKPGGGGQPDTGGARIPIAERGCGLVQTANGSARNRIALGHPEPR